MRERDEGERVPGRTFQVEEHARSGPGSAPARAYISSSVNFCPPSFYLRAPFSRPSAPGAQELVLRARARACTLPSVCMKKKEPPLHKDAIDYAPRAAESSDKGCKRYGSASLRDDCSVLCICARTSADDRLGIFFCCGSLTGVIRGFAILGPRCEFCVCGFCGYFCGVWPGRAGVLYVCVFSDGVIEMNRWPIE